MRPAEKPLDTTCRYVKRIDDQHFEYGRYDAERSPHKKGVKPTLEEALKANNMALHGKTRQQGVWA